MELSIERQLADIASAKVRRAAGILFSAIQSATPVGAHHRSTYPPMRSAMKLRVSGNAATITVPFPARFLEEGTKYIRARHFVQGAVLSAQSSILSALSE